MTTPERFEVLSGGPSVEERHARLVDGADDVARPGGRPSVLAHPRRRQLARPRHSPALV